MDMQAEKQEGDGEKKSKKTHVSQSCCYYNFSTANSQILALLRNALSVRTAMSRRPQNSLVECGKHKVGFLALEAVCLFKRTSSGCRSSCTRRRWSSARRQRGFGLVCRRPWTACTCRMSSCWRKKSVSALNCRGKSFAKRKKDPIPHPLTQESRVRYEVSLLLSRWRTALLINTYVVEMAFCSVAVMATRMFSFSMAASAARFSADLRSSPDMLTVSIVSVARRSKTSFGQTYQTCPGRWFLCRLRFGAARCS
jgi:hypothetical protein